MRSVLMYMAVFLMVTRADALAAPPGHGPADMAAVTAIAASHGGKSGVYVLEKGEESLLARAWLADHARKSIDIQYFIWSSDNIGILASEALLRAADRGVRVRVLVDDLLIDAPPEALLALTLHPNIHIRIYNPKVTVGTSRLKRLRNALITFRSVNQRMHDKTALFDGSVGITGGRNMADEYFDYDHHYNFRDRDVLALGPVVQEMTASFDRFWNSPQAVPVERLLDKELKRITAERRDAVYAGLHRYAGNPENFAPEVRAALRDLPRTLDRMLGQMVWEDARFLSDLPGKNDRKRSLGGGGRTTSQLAEVLRGAKKQVTIQSPYLVIPAGGFQIFRDLVQRGVQVRISTNSLASTDNLMAFSGYRKQRQRILKSGVQVFEFKPDPAIKHQLIERYPKLATTAPVFAIHAKTLVVDGETLYVGTFNLDPRSANLNTEVGILVRNRQLAGQVEQNILRDMHPSNSWNATDKPDRFAPAAKRRKMGVWKMLPLTPLL